MADVVVVNKVDSATPEQVDRVIDAVRLVNPDARLVTAASPVTLGHGSPLYGKRVLTVEDGPTITHGEMEFGAGKVAALGRRVGDRRSASVRSRLHRGAL